MAAAQAITLDEVGAGAWLDLDNPANKKVFISGGKPLHGDPYNGKPKGLRLFFEQLRGRASMYSWNNVLEVPDLTFLATTRNIIDCYGPVTLEECTLHADKYYVARDRASQNAQMLYNCLSTSLTDEALSKMGLLCLYPPKAKSTVKILNSPYGSELFGLLAESLHFIGEISFDILGEI